MRLPHFKSYEPKSLAECTQLLESLGVNGVLRAGGTELLVRMKLGLLDKSDLVALSAVEGIDGISVDGKGALTIGAGTKLSAIAGSPLVRARVPVLANAASLVATAQIRNMATLGGNIFQETRCIYYNRSAVWRKAVPACFKHNGEVCHVAPKGKRCFAVYQGDLAPVLVALGSMALLFRNGREEERALHHVFSGDGKTPFGKGEQLVLAAVRIPPLQEGAHAKYRKYRLRNGMDFPLAGVAAVVKERAGVIEDLSICLTGVSSSPVMVSKASEFARGKRLSPEVISLVADEAHAAARPVDNVEDSAARRRSMVRAMTGEIMAGIADRDA